MELGKLRNRFKQGKLVSIEYNPPKGTKPELSRLSSVAHMIDFINVTDSPMASPRMSAIVTAYIVKNSIGLECIFNMTCRDRNILALQSDMLGAYALGLENVLLVGGDPSRESKNNVYSLNTYGLLNLTNRLNNGISADGKKLSAPTDFFVGVASDIPNGKNNKAIKRRLSRKVELGASFTITQPIYSVETLDEFLNLTSSINVIKIIGFFPVTSYKLALYLHKNVKGISLPESMLIHLQGAPDEKTEGKKHFEKLLLNIEKSGHLKEISGIHLMRFDYEMVELTRQVIGEVT